MFFNKSPFEKEKDPEKLFAAAAAATDIDTKKAALRQVLLISTSSEQLIKALLDFTDAIEKSKEMLTPIVMRQQSLALSIIVSTAIRVLNDEEVINRLASFSFLKPDLQKKIVDKCTDQKILKAIVEHGRYYESDALAQTAIHQITDQKYIREIVADKRTSLHIRCAITGKIDDQAFLERIAADTTDNHSVRGSTARHITNQKFLRDLIEKDQETWVRQGAARSITDPDYLEKLACTHQDENVREIAMSKINNPELALKLYREDPSLIVKSAAIRKVNDQKILLEAALNPVCLGVKMGAQESLTDEDSCKELYLKSQKDEMSRREAVKHIKDQEFLANVVYNDPVLPVRENTLQSITDPRILQEIGQNSTDPAIKAKAQEMFQKVQNQQAATPESNTALNLTEAALQLISQGKREDAKKSVLAALKLDDSNPKAHLILADILVTENALSEAANEYRRFLNLEPFFAKGWGALAKILAKSGDMEQSAEVMKRAASLGEEMAKKALNVNSPGDTCSFCGQQVSTLQTAISANGTFICVNCLELTVKAMSVAAPYITGKGRRGLITKGAKSCSFCGKDEYRSLIDGGKAAICDSCVDSFFKIK